MVNATEKAIENAGYSLIPISPEIRLLSAHRKESSVIVFFLGSYLSEISETLVYLKDMCAEDDKALILLGEHAEIDAAAEFLPTAVVTASFPRPVDMKKLIAEIDKVFAAEDDSSRKKNILLVDDDSAFLKIMKSYLSGKYRVTIVTSGAQALMYIADNTPDLILLDYEMPVTSGPQVLEMIRSETKVGSIPVIFLTGKDDRESVMAVLSLKPDGYLLKNASRESLLKSVDEFFEKRKYESLHSPKGGDF